MWSRPPGFVPHDLRSGKYLRGARGPVRRSHTISTTQDAFHGVSALPHMLSARNAPPGTGSSQAEVYFSINTNLASRVHLKPGLSRFISDPVAAGCSSKTPRARIKQCSCASPRIFDLDRSAGSGPRFHGYLYELGYRLLWAVRDGDTLDR